MLDAASREAFKKKRVLWVNLEEHPTSSWQRDGLRVFSGRLFVMMDYVAPDDDGRVSLADYWFRACRSPQNARLNGRYNFAWEWNARRRMESTATEI